MDNVLLRISEIGIVPVVKIDDAEKAVPLAKALYAGGLPVVEITLRTVPAAEALRRIAAEVPEMLLGAGTVLTCQHADAAVDAGARFIVSPGTNQRVVRHCQEMGVLIVPGVVTPTEIEAALELGLEVLKFFPAEPSGGLPMIKALSAPYPGIRFIPTGGISAANVADYLRNEKILACGGSWMVKDTAINDSEFGKIQSMARKAADIVKAVREGH